jgi:hypothetical protein
MFAASVFFSNSISGVQLAVARIAESVRLIAEASAQRELKLKLVAVEKQFAGTVKIVKQACRRALRLCFFPAFDVCAACI